MEYYSKELLECSLAPTRPQYNLTEPLPHCNHETPSVRRHTPFPPEKDCGKYIGLAVSLWFGRYRELSTSYNYVWKPEPDSVEFWTNIDDKKTLFTRGLHELYNSPDDSSLADEIEREGKEINQYGISLGIRPQIGIAFIEQGVPGYIAEGLDHLAYRVSPDSIKQALERAKLTSSSLPAPEVCFDFIKKGLYMSSQASYRTFYSDYIKLKRELTSLGWKGELPKQIHAFAQDQNPQLSLLANKYREYKAVEGYLTEYEYAFSKAGGNKETAFKQLDERRIEQVAWESLTTILEKYSYLVYFEPKHIARRFGDKWETAASWVQENIDRDNPKNNVLRAAHYLLIDSTEKKPPKDSHLNNRIYARIEEIVAGEKLSPPLGT